jgi:hypothetical protein
MGSLLYSWIVDHWGVNVAGILLIIFVVLYFLSEFADLFSLFRRPPTKSVEGPISNKVSDTMPYLPEITTTLSYLKSSEKR